MPRAILFPETDSKVEIREKISKQFSKWLSRRKTGVFNTLAGQKWIVERNVVAIAKKQKKNIALNNFERHCFLKSYSPYLHKVPKHIELGMFYGKKDGMFKFVQEKNIGSFSWADYCGTPLKTAIEDFRNAIRYGDVIYLTYYLYPRYKKSIDPKCLEALSVPIPERAEKITDVLENIVKEKMGKNFTRILFRSYSNGNGHSPMVTVGWHFKADSKLVEVGA